MFTLIRGGTLYTPEYAGQQDILLAGGRIAAIDQDLGYVSLPSLDRVDARGKLIFPGFVDGHVHIAGGGGEGGFSTRTREIEAVELLQNGITTVVGVLGTDSVTRSMEGLYAKARMLEEKGVSAYLYTGSYQIPVVTLTGSVQRDLVLVDRILGVGEVALADHRSFHPTEQELARLASEARVGGMLSGKRGLVHLHMGNGSQGLEMVFRILKNTEIPASQFLPTHVNRSELLLRQALELIQAGGFADLTAGFDPIGEEDPAISAPEALKRLLEAGACEDRICMSSDGNGSMPVFDRDGNLLGIETASCSVLARDFSRAVLEYGVPLNRALKTVTRNPAQALKIHRRKGSLQVGADGDLLIVGEGLKIETVFSMGARVQG